MMKKVNSELLELQIYVDGASKGNPGPASIGVSIQSKSGEEIQSLSEFIGSNTNNVAEYFAFIYALQEALHLGASKLTIYSDSQLLVRQFSGEYKVKEPHVKLMHRLAKRLAKYFEECQVIHVPREQNKVADSLANQAIEDHL